MLTPILPGWLTLALNLQSNIGSVLIELATELTCLGFIQLRHTISLLAVK